MVADQLVAVPAESLSNRFIVHGHASVLWGTLKRPSNGPEAQLPICVHRGGGLQPPKQGPDCLFRHGPLGQGVIDVGQVFPDALGGQVERLAGQVEPKSNSHWVLRGGFNLVLIDKQPCLPSLIAERIQGGLHMFPTAHWKKREVVDI